MGGTTMVLMGRTGNGKSSTGNSILGRNGFISRWSFSSVTKECELEQTTLKDGRLLNVIDTPGLFDTNVSKEFLQREIVKCIELAKDGVHGILYVLSVKNRFTEEEADVLDSLQMLFGPKILNYMVVVFTGGDALEKEGLTLQDYLKNSPPKLEEVLRRCNMRMVLFDNKTTLETKKEKQRSELLKQIDIITAENEGQPYSNELFHEAQVRSEQQVGNDSRKGNSKEELEKANAEQLKRLNDMKLKMEEMLIDRDLWVAISSIELQATRHYDWDKMDKKSQGLKIIYLANSVLQSVQKSRLYLIFR